MKRTVSIYLFLLLGLSGSFYPVPAQAQFWKKIFGKEEKKPVKRPAPRSAATDKKKISGTSTDKKKQTVEKLRLANTVKKARYRVDVLAPLHLNELVSGGKPVYKNHLPDKVLPGLNFYQGIQLAADTLDGLGYHLDVHLHDITDPKETVDALLKANRLDSADLIIGAVNAPQVGALASLAKRRNINFISTLTPADAGTKSNLYFNLAQPTLARHCDALKAAIARQAKPTANLLMYYRSTVAVDEQCFRMLTKDSAFAYTRVLMNTPMAPEKLRNFLDSNSTNIIVMPIVDLTYAAQLLQQLARSFPRYRFEVYGMPSWKGIANLRKEGAMPNIGITIPAPFYFDPSTSVGKGFSDAYNEKYGGRPGEMAYRGYETMYWYAYLLQRYGTVFNDHYADNGAAPFTRFDIRLSADKDGGPLYYENHHVYLYRYQSGNMSVEQ